VLLKVKQIIRTNAVVAALGDSHSIVAQDVRTILKHLEQTAAQDPDAMSSPRSHLARVNTSSYFAFRYHRAYWVGPGDTPELHIFRLGG
jgi:hypothetical protein